MKAELKVREYRDSDLNQVLFLHRKAMEPIGVYKEGPWNDDLKDITGHYKNNHGIFLVGEIRNKIVAMGAIRKIDENIAEVKRMRTDPQHQGLGYGKTILSNLIRIAKELNYSELILETSDKQVKAINLYKSFGFTEYKKETIDGFNCTWYKLKIVK